MKYKVGDKIVLERELNWGQEVCDAIKRLPNRIATVKSVIKSNGSEYYYMKEIGWNWKNNEIEGLASELIIETNRFELMDFEL